MPFIRKRSPTAMAAGIVLIYGLLASLWIFATDIYVHGLPPYSSEVWLHLVLSIGKGEVFVLVTGGVLFFVLRIIFRRLEDAQSIQERRFYQTMRTLARMVEFRDIYTHGHQQRVAKICRALAERINLPAHRTEALVLAAELHDIGKLGVPEHVLNKAGFLTDNDLQQIRRHAEIGADILNEMDFPGPVADIVRQHHERLDGSGYPDGLHGDEILLEARILTVADVFEAMSSARPYRNAQGADVALVELQRNAGLKYDREIVEECVGWHHSGGRL